MKFFSSKSFRIGEHSTSDDSSRYRPPEEIKHWTTNDYPNNKLKFYMISKCIWNEHKEDMWLKEARSEVLAAFNAGERKLKPHWKEMFTDVYKYMPPHLK